MSDDLISVAEQISIWRQIPKDAIVKNLNVVTENDPPLHLEPLNTAKLDEPVVSTPIKILLHPGYKGGWKVLRHTRPDGGRVDLTYKHKTHGRFRSKKQVLNCLDGLLKMEKEKESADLDKKGSGPNQLAQGMGVSSTAGPLAEGKPSSVTNQTAEGNGAASASNSVDGMITE